MSHSVLVVEDDAHTLDYFAETLRGDPERYSVSTATSLQAGIGLLMRQQPDVVLVDLGLPDGSGLDLIRRARALSTRILPLVITVFGDEKSVIGAIEAGAQGYLLKSEAPDDLRESVRQVLSGGAPISPAIASHLLRRFQVDDSARPARNGGRSSPTERESEVLQLMVKGVPYQEAAEALGVTRSTVMSHVRSIYRKLEVGSRGEAVFEALSQGIVKIEPDP